uniref:Uncharacterized protein n=1 Tax=Chromera velia CCMP2878 TaxID=1169474 RepID=A0A0G4HN01_9ALVE|eukprot:Cvel_1182.t1-p1 / transcript=Cvel_1182.t1 / gene=Cvel_1182 / organism=Chromera_velia_CCMP2878 / gene_product=hypothetical protein / transcript_product=hypothetical protein / location=Cvel_scaffold39:79134-81506(+) / protein_length=791 / sequence_SO=supercontig / SO=protein_coding / is_pseudo=false
MEALGSVLSSGGLPHLLSLDLSDNPLGPSGVRAFAKCLSSPAQTLPLQSLKLARTKAKAEGVEALAEALKAKKTTSLQTLDLGGNEMRALGLKSLVSAINAEAVPHLQVLILKTNLLSIVPGGGRDYSPTAELLSTSSLKELEVLDLSENRLFDMEIAGGGEGVEISATAFAVPGRFPKLKKLDMGGGYPSWMSPGQLTAFATALGEKGAPALQELVLPGGGIEETPEGVVALANALSCGHLSQLRGLKIQHRYDMTAEAFAGLSRSLGTGKVSLLQNLDLEVYRESHEEGVGALAEALRGGGLSSLRRLRLEMRCDPPVSGATLSLFGLALGSGGCRALQELDLGWREEGDEGVGGLAEGLGGGLLPSLRDLSLKVVCALEGRGEVEGRGELEGRGEEEWVGKGSTALGEVLSTGKVPSLRTVSLDWLCNQSFPSLCEGLSRGKLDPPVMVDIELRRGRESDADLGVSRFAEIIRSGKLSGLRKVCFSGYSLISREGGADIGEAFTHADASLNSLQLVDLDDQKQAAAAAFLQGLCIGPGRLPALRFLQCPAIDSTLRAQGVGAVCSLSALMRDGRVPSLQHLPVCLLGIGREDMQAFAAALSCPHVSALRRLDVSFGLRSQSVAADVQVFSVALSSGHLRRLQVLLLEGLRLIEEVRALCAGLGSGKLSSLRTLGLSDSILGVEGGRALSEVAVAEKLPSLRLLSARHTQLRDKGVTALTEGWMSRVPPPLQHLNVSFNQLTGAAADSLLTLHGSKRLISLDTLSLYGNDGIDERSKRLLSAAFEEVWY